MADTTTSSAPTEVARAAELGPVGRFLKATELDTRMLGMVAALILIWMLLHGLSGGLFLTPRNLWNLSVQTSSVAIMATGMVLVIVMRHIDLSVGSLEGVIGMVMGVLQVHILIRVFGIQTGDPWIWVIALACGVAVGIANYALIWLLRIPPIIATLSSSFLVQSVAIAYGRGIRIKPPPALADFTTAQVLGMPVLAICIIALAAFMELVLRRTLYGRWVTAIGQNIRAARLAGVDVGRTRFYAYVMSAVFAGLCGYLLSGFSGGSSLSMGEEYLLTSIALVVIGGSSVAGGNSNVPGLWGAALFLFLVVTMLNTYGFGAGLRYLATGLIIIAVIVAASARRPAR